MCVHVGVCVGVCVGLASSFVVFVADFFSFLVCGCFVEQFCQPCACSQFVSSLVRHWCFAYPVMVLVCSLSVYRWFFSVVFFVLLLHHLLYLDARPYSYPVLSVHLLGCLYVPLEVVLAFCCVSVDLFSAGHSVVVPYGSLHFFCHGCFGL